MNDEFARNCDEFENDSSIPKPKFLDESTETIHNSSRNSTPNRENNFRSLSPECEALLKPNLSGLYSPPRFSSNKSPYDINEQPFLKETDLHNISEKNDQQDEYVSIPIEPSGQFLPTANSSPTPLLHQYDTLQSNQKEIGIDNFDPNVFCTFTDPLTLTAIENIGADPKDLFYPTEAQLLKYSKDPDMKEIARQHQIEMVNKVIALVKTERERIKNQQLPKQSIQHARTQQTTPRNHYSQVPMTLPVSKKRAIEQILASKVKQNRSKSKISNSQLQKLNHNPIKPSQSKQIPPQRPTTSLYSKSGTTFSDKSSLLVEKMATVVNRAKELEEKQKEERHKQWQQREMRAQLRMEELQYIKQAQNQQLKMKNEQKKQQNDLFNQKWKNDNLHLIEEREANEAKEKAEAKREEINKQLTLEIIRLSHDTPLITQDIRPNTNNKQPKTQLSKQPNENSQKGNKKSKDNEIKSKKHNDNQLTPEQLQQQQELIQNLIEKQIEKQIKLEGIRNNRQSILDAKREKVEKAQIEHEERAILFRQAEEKRRKERNLIIELSAEDIKRRREMKDRLKLNERQQRVDRTLQRFEAIDQQQKEMQARAAMARRTPLSVEEANLCRCYERALQLGDNPDENELKELAKQVGINYEALKNRIMS